MLDAPKLAFLSAKKSKNFLFRPFHLWKGDTPPPRCLDPLAYGTRLDSRSTSAPMAPWLQGRLPRVLQGLSNARPQDP